MPRKVIEDTRDNYIYEEEDGTYVIEVREELSLDLGEDEKLRKSAPPQPTTPAISISLYAPDDLLEDFIRARYNRETDEIELTCVLSTRKPGEDWVGFSDDFPAIVSRNGNIRLASDDIPDCVTKEAVLQRIREEIDLQRDWFKIGDVEVSQFDFLMRWDPDVMAEKRRRLMRDKL